MKNLTQAVRGHHIYFMEDQFEKVAVFIRDYCLTRPEYIRVTVGRFFDEPVLYLNLSCNDFMWKAICNELHTVEFNDIYDIIDRKDDRYYVTATGE